jgi:hypothetical protein
VASNHIDIDITYIYRPIYLCVIIRKLANLCLLLTNEYYLQCVNKSKLTAKNLNIKFIMENCGGCCVDKILMFSIRRVFTSLKPSGCGKLVSTYGRGS